MIISDIQRTNKIKGFHFLSTCTSFTVMCCGKTVDVSLEERPELREQASNDKLFVGCVHCSDKKQIPHYVVRDVKFPLQEVGSSFIRATVRC